MPPVLKAALKFSMTAVLFAFLVLATAQAQYPSLQWWYDLSAPSFGSAAVGDIDRDGKAEIVFGTYFNDERIVALNADDGSLLWQFDTGNCNDASPAIADVDLDGELEVIVPTSSGCRVYCFDGATGQIEWSKATGSNCIDSPPAVADVDMDGKPEIVFGTFFGYVYCLNGEDGSQLWRINLGTDSYIQSEPCILDVNGDGELDVVVAQWAGDCRIYALRGTNGATLWFSDQPADYMYHGGSFADIDEDGRPEIAIGCYDKRVYVLNAEDGSPLWSYTAPYYVGAPTSVADLDNDGHLEVVFAAHNRIGVLSHTGSLQWSYTAGGGCFRGAAIADIDGEGTLDVAFGADDGFLRVLRGSDGHVIWSFDLEAHYGKTLDLDHAPVVGDFDGDGKLDIFIIGGYGESTHPELNHGRAYALAAGEGSGSGWPMFRHDVVHSGCFAEQGEPVTVIVPDDFPTLQAAIDAVKDGDTILVRPGTYSETIDFRGKGILVRSTHGPELTIIDGQAAGSVVTFASGEGGDSILDGFSVRNGSGTFVPVWWSYCGGGIYCEGSSPTITRTIIAQNAVDGMGGGIVCRTASPTIDNTIFLQNAAAQGGAIACHWGCTPSITTCTFSENTASLGGALYVLQDCAVTACNSIFWGDAASSGAEIWIGNATMPSSLSISYCDVEGGLPGVYADSGCTVDWGAGMIDADPQFSNAGSGDLTLLHTSPCIDAGDPAHLPCEETDSRQSPRLLDGDLDREVRVDMGACEFDNVRLAISGAGTPGGTLTFETTGTAGLPVRLFIALVPGSSCHPVFGAFFFDFASPWWVYPWGQIPSTVPVSIPPDTPTPVELLFQELALAPPVMAGNTSNAVAIRIE
ncbi:MAG: FG-GAP-like repeat-containing protein [Planctomycetota bacterium]